MGAILRSKLFIAAAIVAVLVGLYALLGFKVLPGIVRNKAIEYVRAEYGRELSIGEVRIHPYKLQLEVRDVSFPDADGTADAGLRAAVFGFRAVFALAARALFQRRGPRCALRARGDPPGRRDELRGPHAAHAAARRTRNRPSSGSRTCRSPEASSTTTTSRAAGHSSVSSRRSTSDSRTSRPRPRAVTSG